LKLIFFSNFTNVKFLMMKKVYLLSGVLLASFALNAQKLTNAKTLPQVKENFGIKKVASSTPLKAEGDVLWTNGFDTPSEWTQTVGSGHSAGDWQIITSLPANITGQQASYQWPATFSAAQGNFAFIDSDAAGGAAAQDAYFEYNANIDLSAAGNAALYLSFNEYYRHFYDENYVEVSINGGTTWTTFQVNPVSQVPVNTNCVDGEIEVVNITPAIGNGVWTNQVRIRFHYVGQWDWFWGIDNIQIVEAWNNDMKLLNAYAATNPATTQGLDYFTLSQSQSSFPGLTFGAIVQNNGALNQASVALKATATGGYDQTGSAIAVNAAATDSVSISTPYIPTGVGTKTIDLTTVITATDSDPANNTASFSVNVTQYEFSRDNGVATGGISNVTSNTGLPLKIGNIMDVFNDVQATGVKLYLTNQAAGADGAEYWAELYKFDGTDYVYWAGTETKTVSGTAASWATLKWVEGEISNGKVNLAAGDDILLLSCHNGGTDAVRFGYAQNTYNQSVLGYTNDGSLFSLTSPSAVMVRLLDDPSLAPSSTENISMNSFEVYPNPANESTRVSFELKNEADVTVQVTDMAGKVVLSNSLGFVSGSQQVEFNTSNLQAGAYLINVISNDSISTKKLIIKK
jgi:hypothetical protein